MLPSLIRALIQGAHRSAVKFPPTGERPGSARESAMGAFKQTCSPLSRPDRIAVENSEFWPPLRPPGASGRFKGHALSTGRPAAITRRRRTGWPSAGAAQTALGQIILGGRGPRGVGAVGVDGDEAVFGPHGGQQGQVTLDLTPDAAERDAEHT